MSEDKLRSMDVFRRFDASSRGVLTRGELQKGLAASGLILDDEETLTLMTSLTARDTLDYAHFSKGLTYRHRRSHHNPQVCCCCLSDLA
jgi:Ca2+-binding EF-hand superfamily protein